MAVTINGTTGIETNTDTGKLKVGASDDLQISHESDHCFIKNTTGKIFLRSDTGIVLQDADGNESFAEFNDNGAVELYYNGIRQAVTDTAGMEIKTGDTSLDTEFIIRGNEAKNATLRLICDDGDDNADNWRLRAVTDGTCRLENYAGGSYETNIRATGNGSIELFHDNSKKFETDTDGVSITGILHAHGNVGDSDYTDHTWHILQSNTNNNTALLVEHSGDTNPYGIFIDFSDHDPDNNTNYFIRGMDSSNNAKFAIYSDGDVWTSDASTLTSDETLKENIVDATPKLEDLKKLKVRNFNWKSSFHTEKSKKKQLGFIAQEVEEVFPALVQEYDIAAGPPDDGHTPVMKKAIKQAWDPIIIKAMQELIAKVETLETEVNTLKTKVATLEAA